MGKAEQLHVHIDFNQKHSRFMMTDRTMTKPIRGRQLSKRELYDEEFFRTHFTKQEIGEAFETFKEKRDVIHEFEVELTEHQIEKLVDEGVYIKVSFGVQQSGLIFISNYQLDILAEENQTKYKVYICETTSYFVYNKEHSDKSVYKRTNLD